MNIEKLFDQNLCFTLSERMFWSIWLLIISLSFLYLFWNFVRKTEYRNELKCFWYASIIIILAIFSLFVFNKYDSPNNVHPLLEAVILIVTALLTYMAFWIQYKFNKTQKDDISRDRFDNRFYHNLDMLMQLEEQCDIPNVGRGKQAFHFMFYEYKAIMCNILMSDTISWMTEELDNKKYFQPDFWEKLKQISFNIFLSGVSTSSKARLYQDCGISQQEVNALNLYLLEARKEKESPFYLDDYDCYERNIKLYDGHRLRLISFFRNVCMLVQFVIDSNDLTDEEKRHYILYILSLFSEHEISLLYIISKYSHNEHSIFIAEKDKKQMESFFTNTLSKFIIAPNMNPATNEKYIDINRILTLREQKNHGVNSKC